MEVPLGVIELDEMPDVGVQLVVDPSEGVELEVVFGQLYWHVFANDVVLNSLERLLDMLGLILLDVDGDSYVVACDGSETDGCGGILLGTNASTQQVYPAQNLVLQSLLTAGFHV
jgi:hypothetical protein